MPEAREGVEILGIIQRKVIHFSFLRAARDQPYKSANFILRNHLIKLDQIPILLKVSWATSREQEASLYFTAAVTILYQNPWHLKFILMRIGQEIKLIANQSVAIGVLAGGLIFWSSKKQTCLATSSCKAELIALSRATDQALYMCSFFQPLHIPSYSTQIFTDNQSAIGLWLSLSCREERNLLMMLMACNT